MYENQDGIAGRLILESVLDGKPQVLDQVRRNLRHFNVGPGNGVTMKDLDETYAYSRHGDRGLGGLMNDVECLRLVMYVEIEKK